MKVILWLRGVPITVLKKGWESLIQMKRPGQAGRGQLGQDSDLSIWPSSSRGHAQGNTSISQRPFTGPTICFSSYVLVIMTPLWLWVAENMPLTAGTNPFPLKTDRPQAMNTFVARLRGWDLAGVLQGLVYGYSSACSPVLLSDAANGPYVMASISVTNQSPFLIGPYAPSFSFLAR